MKQFMLLFLISFCWGCQVSITTIQPPETFEISVVGALKNPTQLTIKAYATIGEVLMMIELLEDSDISQLNPMTILHHHDVLTIPFKQDIPCVSINIAPLDTLITLKGIGPTIAQSIIDYRDEHGYFQHIQQIERVKGIGPAIFQQIKPYICL